MAEPKNPKYSCDNPPKTPIPASELGTKLVADKEFATFFNDLLRKINSGTDEEKERARACLNAWFGGDYESLTSLPNLDVNLSRDAFLCTDKGGNQPK